MKGLKKTKRGELTVGTNKIAILFDRKNRINEIYKSGDHKISLLLSLTSAKNHILIEKKNPITDETQLLVSKNTGKFKDHVTYEVAKHNQIKLIIRDETIIDIIKPNTKKALWKETGIQIKELFVNKNDITVDEDIVEFIHFSDNEGLTSKISEYICKVDITDGKLGLLIFEDSIIQVISAGTYNFWNINNSTKVIIKNEDEEIDNSILKNKYLNQDKVKNNIASWRNSYNEIAVISRHNFIIDIKFPKTSGAYWNLDQALTIDQFKTDEPLSLSHKISCLLAASEDPKVNNLLENAIVRETIPNGYTGILVLPIDNSLSYKALPSGEHVLWKYNPNTRFHILDMRPQVQHINNINIESYDGVNFGIDILMNWQLINAPRLIEGQIEAKTYLDQEVRYEVCGLSSRASAENFIAVNFKKVVADEIKNLITQKAERYGIVIDGVVLKSLRIPPALQARYKHQFTSRNSHDESDEDIFH